MDDARQETTDQPPLDLNLLRLFVQAMCVDGDMAVSEQEKIRELSVGIGWDEATVNATIIEQITSPTKLETLLDAITDPQTQETAVTVCSAIVAADGVFQEPERNFVTQLCEAWGFDPDGLITGIEQVLGSV